MSELRMTDAEIDAALDAAVAAEDNPREAFLSGIFDLVNFYDIPVTNNEPRMQDGRWLREVGSFAGHVRRLAEATLMTMGRAS